MAISLKGTHFPTEVILMGVRWYVAYPLSTHDVEELMEERGVDVDHSTINRWTIKYSLLLEEAFHWWKRPVWVSWRLDETSIKVKGQWRYLYRAIDKTGQTIDFLLTEERDEQAAKRFLTKAIRREARGDAGREHRQSRYLNNGCGNSHRPTRERERRMQRFKSPGHAQRFLAAYGPIASHFRPCRHLLAAPAYRRERRQRARHYLWRAVDQDGTVLDILVQRRRDKKVTKQFFGKLLKGCQYVPRVLMTDKLKSYAAAKREILPGVEHRQHRYLNNRAENSYQPTRQRERRMQGVTSPGHAQRFLAAYRRLRRATEAVVCFSVQ